MITDWRAHFKLQVTSSCEPETRDCRSDVSHPGRFRSGRHLDWHASFHGSSHTSNQGTQAIQL